jgi:hypothetical protein
MTEQPKTWTVTPEEDPETGDVIITFPPDLLKSVGWKDGDNIKWIDNGNGSYTLQKATK